MRNLQKRIVAFLLTLVLLAGMLPVPAYATQTETEPSEPEVTVTEAATEAATEPVVSYGTISAVHINPLYAGVISEEDLVAPGFALMMADEGEEPVYETSLSTVAQTLRAAMVARETTCTVHYQTTTYEESLPEDIFSRAVAHTGASTQGDYLKWQYAGWEVNGGYSTDGTTYYLDLTYTLTYYTTAEQEAELDAAVNSLLGTLNLGGASDYEKLKGIYDYICANVSYDNANLNDSSYLLKFTAYAALVNKTAVCQGYAVLFYRLALALGVDCRVVTGTSFGQGHAWNIAKIGDYYYNLDSTWDAGLLTYSYFLRGSGNFPNHTQDSAWNSSGYAISTTDYDPNAGTEDDYVASGTCGDNLTWTLDEAGTLTISGTGVMRDYSGATVPWSDYQSSVKKVVVDNGVTRIGEDAFRGCDSLTIVELPDSVITIGVRAFYKCPNLTSAEIPGSVISIGEYAFARCTALTNVEIPNSVTRIGDYTFISCESLASVTIGNSVATIGTGAFQNCISLKNVEIPNSVTSIGTHAFKNCTSLTNVKIPNSVSSIGDYAFQCCKNLTNVEISNSVTSIGVGVFEECTSLKNVQIPDSVTSIGIAAFFSCTSLSSVTIPDSVTEIGMSAFQNCTSLSSVTIPNSITKIEGTVFKNCTGLTNVEIPDSVTHIYNDAFRSCTALTGLTLGNSVSEIGSSAFSYCTSLSDVTIPDSVTEIDSYAFSGCTGLKEITFEGDAPSFGDYAFRDVTATAYYPANEVTWTEDVRQNYDGIITWIPSGEQVTVIASGTCGPNATWTLDDAGTLTIFGTADTFSYKNGHETPWYPYYSSIKSVVVKDGITYLGSYSFADCTSLTSVTFGDSVQHIMAAVFQGCTGLTSVTFGNSFNIIGSSAFQGCTGLTSMTIPDTVTSIGEYVFADCIGLTSVTLGNSLNGISSFMFSNCTGLTSVTIPNSAVGISESAFAGCTGLTSVTIGNSVESIRENAFASCVNLREIIFWGCAPTFIPKDGEGIFYNVTATAYYPSVIDRWTKDVRQDYGGSITWVPYESEHVIIDSGTCGFGVTWKLDTTGTLTISGTGEMRMNLTHSEVPWYYVRKYVKTVIIDHGVTCIGDRSFYDCMNLTNVTIPDSVTYIGDNAFYRCRNLPSVTIPDSVTYLGQYAFSTCTSLVNVVIPDSVTDLGMDPFYCCTGLTSVTFGNSIKSVEGFCGCTSLTSVTFGNSVESIGTWAFRDCSSLVSVTIPDSVTYIGQGAFRNCTSLASVTIPASVETMGIVVFEGCTSLSEIIFKGNAPDFLYLSNDLAEAGSLHGVVATAYYPANNDTWTEEVRQGADGQIIWVPYESGPAIIAIGACGANLTWKLTEDGVLTIFGTGAMYDFAYPESELWWSFNDSIHSVVIEDGVTSIGDNAFVYCHSLTNVTIGKSVASIGTGAFCFCNNLNQVFFKGSAPTFGDGAFADVTATAYYYPDESWTEDVMQNYGGNITWIAKEKAKLLLNGVEFAEVSTVWVDGLPCPVIRSGDGCYVDIPNENAQTLVTYSIHVGDTNDVHTQYPTGMKVYRLSKTDSGFAVTYIPEFDNLLQYAGSSIRITGKKGIRMITSITKDNKAALTGNGLAGYTLVEYGTALCWATDLTDAADLVLGKPYTRSNFAYKKGVADPIFASPGNVMQYTNVLVGFTDDQCIPDIVMRPYIIVEDASGTQITIYGGTVYRSIGYIAYQNRNAFKPGTASYAYVWGIIHHVYGDKYDADYKG